MFELFLLKKGAQFQIFYSTDYKMVSKRWSNYLQALRKENLDISETSASNLDPSLTEILDFQNYHEDDSAQSTHSALLTTSANIESNLNDNSADGVFENENKLLSKLVEKFGINNMQAEDPAT